MSHFYDNTGQLHECDIKEARANKWVAGTTEIIHEFSNSFGLDLYKQKQMFLSSLTMPRPEGITDEAFYDLVVEDSRVHSEKAKEWGVEFHYKISDLLKVPANWPTRFNPALLLDKKVIETYDWVEANKDSVIVDFKTQETKDGKFKQPYNDWLFQLCGYKMHDWHMKAGEHIEYEFYNNDLHAFGGKIDYACFHGNLRDKVKLINLIVSSNEDIPIKVYPWKPEKIEWGCATFLKMVELYRIIKKL